MSSSFYSEMMDVFLEEADEQLQIMEQEILNLEETGGADEAVQRLFRAAHTLKGSSAAMGFEEMKHLTHEMEHLLDRVRNHQLELTNELVDLLLKCLDHLKILKEQITSDDGITLDINPIVAELRQVIEPTNEAASGSEAKASEPQAGVVAIKLPKEKVQEIQAQGLQLLDILVKLAPGSQMRKIRAQVIYNRLQTFGEILHTSPPFLEQDIDDSVEAFLYLLATNAEFSRIEKELATIIDVAEVNISPHSISVDESESKVPDETKSSDETKSPAEKTPESKSAHDNKKAAKPAQDEAKKQKHTIRVDVERLDHLLNLVGELVIDQTRIAQVGSSLQLRYSSDEHVDELEQIADHISRIVGELQESVMKVRMLPIGQLFSRFPRVVRDLSQSLKKEVELVIEGHDTELDRTVIEAIGDPLIHMIRNAVDHGIEPAEERIRKGKPAKGLLRITAAHKENQVVITVEDDGAGIDPEKMRNLAVQRGMISEDEARKMSDQDAIHLIFRAGFSTAKTVSEVSGRGVGMDIVRNEIEKLSGIVDIETELDKGTRFKVRLPLTLAIITGLLIRLNTKTFILPMSSVVEIVRMMPEKIQNINGEPVVVFRDQVLSVVWLHDVFGIPREEQKKKKKHLPVVVVGTGDRRMALVVDELLGNQEVVVKPLGSYVGKIEGISGATILGDGRVALILEVAGINKRSFS